MYLGHLGLGFGAKRVDPGVPLAGLLLLSSAPDLLDPLLSLAGLDGTALTHTMPATVIMAATTGGLVWAISRRWFSAVLCAALVTSHFVTDLITSRLELWIGGPTMGFGLYSLPWMNFILEGGLIVAGWSLYVKTLPAHRQRHPLAFAMLALLVGLQAAIAALGVR